MLFAPLIAPIFGFIFRELIVKFFIFTAVFALLALLVPKAISLLGGFIAPTFMSSAFSVVAPGVWYFLDMFELGYGLPIIISAYIARFLIRRLPFIG